MIYMESAAMFTVRHTKVISDIEQAILIIAGFIFIYQSIDLLFNDKDQ